MTKKIEIAQMTMEEIIAYSKKVKQNNRDYNARLYKNTIKTDPEKYEIWKQKCQVENKKYYDKKKWSYYFYMKMT